MSAMSPLLESRPVSSVLAELADIASETLELQEVFDRIAAVVRQVIPFDNMGVVRIIDGQRAVAHATTVPESERAMCSGPQPLTSWSPRWRPRPGAHRRIDDGPRELDSSFPMDARVLQDGGLGSGLWEPFRRGDHFAGGVWLCSRAKHSFTDEHQEILKPIAALWGSGVEHGRIWEAERRRTERLDRTEALFAPLAESLDLREVFPRLSEGMRAILPHDFMVLTSLDVRARTIQVKA